MDEARDSVRVGQRSRAAAGLAFARAAALALPGAALAQGGTPYIETVEVELPASTSPFLRGDANEDGSADVSDAVRILDYLFVGGGRLSCPDAGDVDDSGNLELTDAVTLLDYLFRGSPAPAPLDCASDGTEDTLEDCATGC